jgi:uncharacterized protein YcnI
LAAVRRTLLALALLALLVPAGALAHGAIQPTAAPAGTTERFVVSVANSLQGGPGIVGVSVEAPDGVEIESAEAQQPRWTVSWDGQKITWEGGPLEGLSEDFAFRAKLPEAEGTYDFTAQEIYVTGLGPPFALPVTVTRTAEAAAAVGDDGDDDLAWIAIALASTALLLAAVAALAAAAAWRRSAK